MGNDSAMNTAPTIPAELFGISGNLLAVLIVLAGVLVAVALFIIVGWLQKKAETTHTQLDDIIIAALGTPAIIASMVVSTFFALQVAELSPDLEWLIDSKYFDAIYILLGAWVISTLAYNIITTYGSRLAGKTETDIDDRMVALGLIVTKYLIWFIALMLILSVLEFDITPLLAGAGIVGIAIALAAQDILSNFLGGAMIAVDRPFRVGDRIQIDEYYGDVISVGPRSTRLKTLDNQIVTVPNTKVINSFVINYALPDVMMKVRINIGVAYGSDVLKVKEVLLGVAREVAERYPYVLTDPEPVVYFLEFADSSLNFQLIVWCNDYTKVWDTKDSVNTRIDQRFAEEKIIIPFPQRDVHLKQP